MAKWSTMTIQTLLRISSTMISVSQAQTTMRSLKRRDLDLHARPDPASDRNIVTIDMKVPNGKTTAAKGQTVVLASSEDVSLNSLVFLLALAEHADAIPDGCVVEDLFDGQLAPADLHFDFDSDAADENVIRGVHLEDRDVLSAQVRLWLKAAGRVAGVPNINPHTLRRSGAIALDAAGASYETISAQLLHRHAGVCYEYYVKDIQ